MTNPSDDILLLDRLFRAAYPMMSLLNDCGYDISDEQDAALQDVEKRLKTVEYSSAYNPVEQEDTEPNELDALEAAMEALDGFATLDVIRDNLGQIRVCLKWMYDMRCALESRTTYVAETLAYASEQADKAWSRDDE